MTGEQRQHIISAFWQGFAAGMSTPAFVIPPAEYLTSLDATWTSQDVANHVRADIDGIPLVKLGDWLLSASGMSALSLTAQLGSDRYEGTLLVAEAGAGYNVSVWELGGMEVFLVSAQFAMMGLPEPGTYMIDLWSMEGLEDCEVCAALRNVTITDSAIKWSGMTDGLETATMPLGDIELIFAKVSDAVPSTNLSDYTGISIFYQDGSSETVDIGDESDNASLKKIAEDSSYISLGGIYAFMVLVDSVDLDGLVLTKGVWFLKIDDEAFISGISGNFTNE